MTKYNLSSIMASAWRLYRKGIQTFSEALRLAWANAKAHRQSKEASGVNEDTHTWSGWKKLGYEVIHESKALYKVIVADPATKNGKRTVSYFGASQVQPMEA